MKNLFSLRNLFLWGNVLLFVLMVAAIVKDSRHEWEGYQKNYYKMEVAEVQSKLANAKTDAEKDSLQKELKFWKSQPVEIKQIIVPALDRVDRCITCHVGMDTLVNPTGTNDFKEAPYAAPADEVHRLHPGEKFGCAVCHGGQGLATTVKAAHGEVEHWEHPLLRGVYIQASCEKCHSNVEDLKVNGKPYATAIIKAKEIVKENGCIGCHQIRGWGGPISVDWSSETADKPLVRIDFTHTGLPKDQWSLRNWIKLHLTKDPAALVPGDPKAEFNSEPIAPSGMPYFAMPNDDADAVTAYILSLTTEQIPKEYYVYAPPKPEPRFASAAEHGKYVFFKYGCAACHGPDAKGGRKNYNYEGDVEPNLRKSVTTYTREELIKKIQNGVPIVGKKDPKGPNPPLYMPPWKDKIKGKELDDLVTYLFSIGEKQEQW
jgi:mono/diheme cytochrome c family protein